MNNATFAIRNDTIFLFLRFLFMLIFAQRLTWRWRSTWIPLICYFFIHKSPKLFNLGLVVFVDLDQLIYLVLQVEIISFNIANLVLKFDLILNLHSGHQNFSLDVNNGRIHLFGLFLKKGNADGSCLAYRYPVFVLWKLSDIKVEFIEVGEDVLYLFGFALENVGDSGLVASSSVRIQKKENDSLCVENYFGFKASNFSLKYLLQGHISNWAWQTLLFFVSSAYKSIFFCLKTTHHLIVLFYKSFKIILCSTVFVLLYCAINILWTI